ncbi:MAG: DUF1232 domain-containing protein [Bdellovibrionales bacterium]|nr:DUF1232 domain-containing protein [Bdellovibrionales bacterium]
MRSGKKYPFPEFPTKIRETFGKLAQELPDDEVHDLNTRLTQTIRMFAARDERYQSGLMSTSLRIAQVCETLLSRYDNFKKRERELIVGAVRYFILQRDGLPDDTPFLGLEDDVQVLNYVLEQLGLDKLAVELDLLE